MNLAGRRRSLEVGGEEVGGRRRLDAGGEELAGLQCDKIVSNLCRKDSCDSGTEL